MEVIASARNPKVSWLRKLHKSSVRKQTGLFVCEGGKELGLAIEAGYQPHTVFIRHGNHDAELLSRLEAAPKIRLEKDLFAKLVYRESDNSGLIVVFEAKKHNLKDFKPSQNPFLMVVETVEKPGNLGSIIRIADGCGADAVVITEAIGDIYNPNVIRGSVGTVFSKPTVETTNTALEKWFKEKNIQVFAAALGSRARIYTDFDYSRPTAIILGAEATGLSDFWLQAANNIMVPMKGRNDSLNVATAAAVLAYEVVRQRS